MEVAVKKKIVFSLGGSVMIPNEFDVKFLKGFSKLIKKYKSRIHFSVVCGGGKPARLYTTAAKKMKIKDVFAHKLGIKATHMNSMLIAELIGGKFSDEHPIKIGKKKGLYVSGGYKIGWTTDTDAAYIAESMKANVLINVTDVKGVYTDNPDKNPKAKFLPKLSWNEFFKISGGVGGPGGHFVFDPVASRICKRNKTKVYVISKNLKNLENVLKGKRFIGTIIE